MWLWNKKLAREVTKVRSCSYLLGHANHFRFYPGDEGIHQQIEAGLKRLVPKAEKGTGSGSGPIGNQGRLDTSSAPRVGGKEPNGKAFLGQISN